MIETQRKLIIELKKDLLIQAWQEFCQLHSKLYELTCDEYSALLSSEVERLEETLEAKKDIINEIYELDSHRDQIIHDINEELSPKSPIKKIHDLILFFKPYDTENYIEKYNALLVDIVGKIQDQNKTNQIYLNKAILSLQELRESFKGTPSYKTYNNMGKTTATR